MENRVSVRSICSRSTSGAGWIRESVRTPERNQPEATEATERQLPLPLRFLCWLLFNFGNRGRFSNPCERPSGTNRT